MLGNYYAEGGATVQFLVDGPNWTWFQCPLGRSSFGNAISGDRVVGNYTDTDGRKHGFLLTTPEPASLALLALATLPALRRRRT